MPLNLKFSHKILLAAALVVTATFALFTLYNDYQQRNAMRDNLQSYLREVGESTAGSIQNWLSGRILLVEQTAQTLAREDDPGATTGLLEQRALASTFDYTYLGGQDGSFTMRPDDQMPAGYDPRNRPWYTEALAAGGTTLTEPYVDANTQSLVITIATPSGNRGVVGSDLSLKTLTQLINSLQVGGMGYAFLISADGKILVHPNKDLLMKNLKEVYPQNTPPIDDTLSEGVLNGTTRLVTFFPVKGLPSVKWYIGLSVEKDKAYAMLSQFRASALVATLVTLVCIILLLGMLIRVLMRPLNRAMQDIIEGEGDLTRRLAIHTQDEIGELANAFNRFIERIHDSIRNVSTATHQLNEVASQVVRASDSSMESSSGQAQRTGSVATAVSQLGCAAQEIARNAADASTQASDARQQAEDVRQVVDRTIASMRELSGKISASSSNIEALNGKTADIGQILAVITGISEQTNLLALNAAIEAARAGEAGRGFAVVADEVRNLAHRTQMSAQEIHSMIEELQAVAHEAVTTMTESQRYSEESVEIANQAGERLGQVTRLIEDIDGMNQSVAAATEEQTAVIGTLNQDISEINTLNEKSVNNLQTTLRACSELEQQAAGLKKLVNYFRI